MGDGHRIDQGLRWHVGTNVFVDLCILFGLLIETIGLFVWHFAGRRWLWLPLVGGGLLAIGLTIVARRRNRSWAWGLLGFFQVVGLYLVLHARWRCERCRLVLPKDADRCPDCKEEPIPGT